MAKRILVIEDDPDILEILSLILSDEGYQVIPSINGAEAENLGEDLPDLVLLDLRLSGSMKTGAEICAQLKAQIHTRKVPVILVSAETNVMEVAISCGADAFIKKPFNIDDLSDQVKTYLNI